MKKRFSTLIMASVMMLTVAFGAVPAMANTSGENWIDATGNTAPPRNSRDVRNNTNGFDTRTFTPISFEGEVTLYAQNYGFGNDDNYDIKLYIRNGSGHTQIGRLYGYGDALRVEVFAGHSIRLMFQRHQIENRFYVVDLTGPFSTTYRKDFRGENTGFTSGDIFVRYNRATTPPGETAVPSEIRVLVNGAALSFDQPPIIENGRTLVPLRAIFEALGATVSWEQSTQTVTATRGSTTVTLRIGSEFITRNGEQIRLDVPARIVGGRTLVPARAVAESFGAQVDWNQTTRTVTIAE